MRQGRGPTVGAIRRCLGPGGNTRWHAPARCAATLGLRDRRGRCWPGVSARRPGRRRARLVAQRRIGHRGREAAARRIRRRYPRSSDGRSAASSDADASARCRHHLAASFGEFTASPHAPTPTLRNLPPSPASSTIADARSLLAYVPPKFPRGEPAPHSHVRTEYGESGDRRANCSSRRKTNDALVPPKPNEFDSTVSIFRFFERCGTRSIAVSTDGLSRLIVGGAMPSRMARIEKIASTAPAAPSRCPIEDLVDDMLMCAGIIADQPLHRAELDFVAERRRGAMRVDVVDLRRRDAGARDRHLHATECAVAVFGRRGDVVGVARQSVADDFGVDPGAALLGMLERSPARPCRRPRPSRSRRGRDRRGATRFSGVSLKAGGQRPAGDEAGHADARDRRFRAARHHDFRVTERDQPRRIADRVRAARACGHHRMVRAAQTVRDRDISGREIDQPARE